MRLAGAAVLPIVRLFSMTNPRILFRLDDDSATDGVTTRYEYDAAGRMIKEGDKTCTYGYLDKVMSVRDGKNRFTYTYHPDGQLATADYGNSGRARTPAAPQGEDSPSFETFTWDGLALIQRGNEHFINEPHVGGGNPVVSSKGTSYFNDMLGTTVGAKSGKTYSAATLSAFGEDLNHHSPTSHSNSFFTGKPAVAGLGHAFLMRNYRAGLGKWQTADPLGYPNGWNQLKYGVNSPGEGLDMLGCSWLPFGDDIEYTLIGQNIGVDVPIPGYSGTTLYCKGGATKIQITVPGQQCSVSIKFSPDLTGLTNMSVELLERVMSVLKGAPVSLTFEIKPMTISVDITQFVCSAHKHTDVTIHRGMADVRVYMQRYFDVYLGKNKKTGEETIKIVDNGSWKSDVVYTELKKCE